MVGIFKSHLYNQRGNGDYEKATTDVVTLKLANNVIKSLKLINILIIPILLIQ